MKEKVYAAFSSIEDAKNAFGQIKKTSWNKADLTIVFSENLNHSNLAYEFAGEGFINDLNSNQTTWPGVDEFEIEGIGKVFVGQSAGGTDGFSQSEIDLILKEKDKQRLFGIIEVEPDILPHAQFIMESCGGEMLFNQEDT